MTINKEQTLRKNLTTVAIYNALFYENKHRQKALITITLGDEKLTSLFRLRREFIAEIRKTLKRVAYKEQKKIAYFTNIELGASAGELNKEFNPHIHFQFYYDNFEPIKNALAIIEKKFSISNQDTQIADNTNAYMGYVIKDYLAKNFDKEFEARKKQLGMKLPLYTSSRKSISNYVIRYIYHYYKKNAYHMWKALPSSKRYDLILKQIKKGNIQIEPLSDTILSGFKAVKKSQVRIRLKF
jgi:hypothetical protein